MKFDLDYKKLKIDDGWGGIGGMAGTVFGDSMTIQQYANTWNDKANKILERKNASEEVKKDASDLDGKLFDLFDEGLDLYQLIKTKKKINLFSMAWRARTFIPHYYYEEEIIYRYDKNGRVIKNYPGFSKIKYFFIAEAITHSALPLEVSGKDLFSDDNDNFKKLIIDHLDPNKTEWKHLADLEIPSGRFYVCDKSYYKDRWKNLEAAKDMNVFITNKKMKIFSVITDRKKLLENYNSQTPKDKLIDEKHLQYENGTLPKDKIFHGIMIC